MLVEHGRCAEHGEIVHGTEVHHLATPRPSSGARAGTLADRRPAEAGEHEHCALNANRREASLDIDHAGVAVGSLHEEQTLAPVVRDRPPGIGARFRVAPKTSPPA